MNRNSQNETTKIQSPHPALQTILPRLRALNPDRNDSRPIFDNKAKARLFIDIQSREDGPELTLTPVWAIEHTDLNASDIEAWTVTRLSN